MPEERPRRQTPTVTVPRWIQLVTLPLLLLALWAIARAAGPVLLLFAVAAVIALVLNPLVRQIQRTRLPRGIAIAIVYVGFFAALTGGAILLANPIGDQIATFQRNVPGYVDDANRGLDNFQDWLDRHNINVQVKSGAQDALDRLERDVVARSGDILNFTRDLIEKVIAGLFALVLIIVISVYMLVYGRSIGDAARRVMPPGDGTVEDDFPRRVERAVAGYVRGQLLFSLIMGTSATIMLWFLGTIGVFPDGRTYAVFFGVFYGLMELVPFIGPVIGAAPPVIVALFENPLTAIWVVIAFVALQQLEGHVVAPNVFGRALRINPLLVIFALLFGAELYGVVGALVSLPVAAMLRETIMYLREHLTLEPWPAAAAPILPMDMVESPPAEPAPAASSAQLDDRDDGARDHEDDDEDLEDDPEAGRLHRRGF
jgi:predicted PurR-regulated permease PerM